MELQRIGNFEAYINKQIIRQSEVMGLECAKPREPHRSNTSDNKEKAFQAEMRKIKEVTTFQIKINNLRLLNLNKSFQDIKIQLRGYFLFNLSLDDFNLQDNVFLNQSTYVAQFQASIGSLIDRYVSVFLSEQGGRSTQVLKIKVNQLFRGPVKHDHLLKQFKSRMLFNFHIDQYLQTNLILENCEVQWADPLHHADYTYFLSLIFSNSRPPIQTCKVFQKHQKIKELVLNKNILRYSELRDSIIRIQIIDSLTQENIFQYFLPFSKLQLQGGFKTIKKSEMTYKLYQLQIVKDICLQDQSSGAVKFQLKFWKSKLYVQQMDCVILSQNGIVMHTLSESQLKYPTSSQKQLDLSALTDFTNRLQSGKQYGISQLEFYGLVEGIYIEVQDKHFAITDQLFKTQQGLLNFLLLLTELLQSQKQLQNECTWGVINYLCKQPILKLKYFCCIKNQHQKIIFATKFYRFIFSTLQKIIKLAENGISFKELISIHEFIAFTYFRLPWCQEEIVKVLQRKGDPAITEEKLAEIGASYALKSPSKNYFYDWEGSVLRLIRKDEEYLMLVKELNQAKKGNNDNWAKLLFDRDYQQLFYSIYSSLWDEAQSFLNNNGKILWEYFPRYGELLSIFFGEMNSSKIVDFSAQMTKCNMKLIKNEKLLTTFMMLIFPKTHLYETYCVIKCLNLIQCYFSAILDDHKKLPFNFHYNYFYAGIKCILQSEHSYLLQKMLSIIYKFYFIFTKQFKQCINNFIINKVFYKLFLHWSPDVRSIFHLLLIFKIYQAESEQNPEINLKKSRNISDVMKTRLQYEHVISQLTRPKFKKQSTKIITHTKVNNDFFERMKTKLSKKSIQKAQFSVINEDDYELLEGLALRKCSCIENTPILNRRKWSVADDWQFEGVRPTETELKYIQTSLIEFQNAKKEPKPDQKVQARSKMTQAGADE